MMSEREDHLCRNGPDGPNKKKVGIDEGEQDARTVGQ